MASTDLNERKRFDFSLMNQGSAAFDVVQLEGVEAISQLYRFDLMLVSESANVDFDAVLQNTATLTIFSHDSTQAHKYRGVIVEFEQLGKINKFVFYRAVLEPRISLMDLNKISEVYLNEKNIPQIVEQVLQENDLGTNDYEFKLEDLSAYRQRSFVGQYSETSRNFISRLMESAGMYYFFDHGQGDRDQEKLIVVDYKEAHPEQVLKLSYCAPEDLQTEFQDKNIVSFICTQSRLPESAMIKDFNYRKASQGVIEASETVSDTGSGLMMFHGNNLRTAAEASALAKIRAQELSCQGTIFSGDATAVGVRSGYFIELSEHYRDSFNAQYLVTEVHHLGSQEQLLFKDTTVQIQGKKELLNYGTNYQCSFKAIPREVQFRAQRLTPKPVMAGVISAVIDAEGTGQFAEMDEFGQYKVQFLVDRNKKNPNKGSARLRMASPSVGSKSGMHFPLLKGTEVLIAFSGGDPDRPVILGAVPDSAHHSVVTNVNYFNSEIKTPSGNRLTFSDQTGKAGFELVVPGVMRMGSFDGKGTGEEDTKTKLTNPLAKPSYTYFSGPAYDFSASNKTSFTVGASHVFSANLINEAKLNFGTEIKGGFSSSIKLGPEIEFKHPLTKKYEIDLEAQHVKDTKADASNFYNATQFRATAGELAATALNQVDAVVTTKAKRVAYVALVLQLAATSLTISTAVKATLGKANTGDDVPFWGGTGGKYWGSWSTALIDGLSLFSLATAFVAGYMIDGNKRKTPERHKNFLNMDHNTGIMMGVQSSNVNFGSGSWYQQNHASVEIGCYDDMGFNAALTDREFNPVAVPNKPPSGRLFISYQGVEVRGGNGNVDNIVPNGQFNVQVANVVNPRLQLDRDNSWLRRPDPLGANFGLEMQSACVKLSLDAETDLDLGTGGMVKLRKGAATSLSLASDTATLAATTINLTGTDVNINGANFKVGKVTLGDLECLVLDVSQSLTQHTVALADGTARTAKNIAEDAARRAEAVADEVERVARETQLQFMQMTVEFESQTEFLLNRIRRLRR